MARSVILHQPNEFALLTFMGPVRVSHLWWLLFQKMEGNSATLFVMWLQNSLLAEGPREPSIQYPLFKHLHLSLKQAVSSREAITFPTLTQTRNRSTIWPLCHFQKSNLPRDQVSAADVFALCFI